MNATNCLIPLGWSFPSLDLSVLIWEIELIIPSSPVRAEMMPVR